MAEHDLALLAADPESFRSWLTPALGALARELTDELRAAGRGSIDAEQAVLRSVAATGATAYGWPVCVGGLGGGVLHRAVFYEELALAGLPIPHSSYTFETLAPTLLRYGTELQRAHIRGGIAATEIWCQGFSESDAGSDLGSLRLRAERRDRGWVFTGEKLWVSLGAEASMCLLLARTGTAEARHRGLTMFFVSLDDVGASARRLPLLSERDELAAIHFAGGTSGLGTVVGEVGGGWEVTMHLLQFERGMYAWQRHCWLGSRLEALRLLLGNDHRECESIGTVVGHLEAIKARARATLERLERGEFIGAEASVDKLLLTWAERKLFDIAWRALELDTAPADDDVLTGWRRDYFYSRMSSVYGGASEVQLDTVAERLLGLPRDVARRA